MIVRLINIQQQIVASHQSIGILSKGHTLYMEYIVPLRRWNDITVRLINIQQQIVASIRPHQSIGILSKSQITHVNF